MNRHLWSKRLGLSLAAGMVLAIEALAQPLPPVNLRCEYRPNPLGLSNRPPRLSWQVNDSRRGAVQSAYQVVVSTDPKFAGQDAAAWDSGKVQSDQCVNVLYAGRPVESGTRYYWRVRTWDAEDKASDYSEAARWEMGIWEDLSVRWIAAEDPTFKDMPAWGDWVWNQQAAGDKETAFFRVALTLPDAPIQTAGVKVAVDDTYEMFVNGKEVGRHHVPREIRRYEVTNAFKPGQNVIAIRAYNDVGRAGLNLVLRIRYADGKTIDVRTDSPWRTSQAERPGWNDTGFDDSSWERPAPVGKFGEDHWKDAKETFGQRRSLCMRKDFKLKGKPVRARAYASGLGIYELRINGKKAGPDIFAPGWTYYPKHTQYQTYDLTDLLKEGDNAAGAMLGNGWLFGGMPWAGSAMNSDQPLRFACQINIEYADGSKETLGTEDSWKAFPSPVVKNSFYHGETYDARLELPGWDSPGFDAGNWWGTVETGDAIGNLVPEECEPILLTQELPAMHVIDAGKGTWIYDFGQNMAGWCRLKVKGPRGTEVRLRFCEVLTPDGKVYRDNYRSAQVTDYYILKGEGEEVWEPRFTYRGFRFCEVTGYPGKPGKDALVACVVHSAPEWTGNFECSNFLLNRIYQCVRWGHRSNMHSVPTDCPQRDERLGWMGDAQAFAHTACLNMNMAPFFAKWMRDVTDCQAPDGHVTDVAPSSPKEGPAAPGWGDAVTIVPWTVWKLYGDTRIIEDNYAGMVAWVEYMRKNAPNHLYEREGYGDWVAMVESPKKPIGAAHYYYSTKLVSEMAAAIGRSDDAKKYADLAGQIAAAFNAKYLDGNNNYPGGTQTANILPLAFGITPEDRRVAVLANIVKDIKVRDNHLSTGFMGTMHLLPLLTANGQHELAYTLATQTTWPSWGHMVLNGATSIWELWDGDRKGPDMNSRNHFTFGTVARWYYESLAGIQLDPASPGFKHFVIKPQPAGDLLWAEGQYKSMYGMIRSEWCRRGNGLNLKIVIPANTSATVHVPVSGLREPIVSEAGRVLLRAGKPEHPAAGIKFARMDPDAVVFEMGAGEYTLEMSK